MSRLLALLLLLQEAESMTTVPLKSGHVVVCGSSNLDMIASGERLPLAGETIMHSGFQTCFGGKGANQAVQAARLGSRVEMICKVGRDLFGDQMLANFEANAVSTKFVTQASEGVPSGVALITVGAAERTNTIVVVPGANSALTPADVENARASFEGAAVLLCQMEVPLETTLAALKMAKGLSVLNTAPVPPEGVPDELLLAADIVCPNEVELSLLTGLPTTTVHEAATAARALLDRGARTVLATLGSQGCLLVRPGHSPVHVPAQKTAAIDTTGAGDSFLGAFAAFIARGDDTLQAVRAAGHVAATSVTRTGTQPSYPSLKEVDFQTITIDDAPSSAAAEVLVLQDDGSLKRSSEGGGA